MMPLLAVPPEKLSATAAVSTAAVSTSAASPASAVAQPAASDGDDGFAAMLAHYVQLEPVFDALPDVAFFVKDAHARYALVNRTLAQRCGYKDKRDLYGKAADEVFPRRFGRSYVEQDLAIIAGGRQLTDQLELHLYSGRQPGWCLTCKEPLRNAQGKIVGIAGLSRDLRAHESSHPAYSRIADVVRYIHAHYVQPLNLKYLAAMAGMSVAQLERYFHKVFHLTPRQMLLKARLDAATALLVTHDKVTDVAALCGYTDHSAFTRQFKATVGVTPTEYRLMLQEGRGA
ncbi:AraC family transcriptional regulator [Burkholderia oklahomensis]|uniref:Helix-turn-helix domain protein n=1 Tax=Burkholderia oklahomensis TaxID=342113 RepID=A0AAI8BBY8_9BURK|nr:AraC family transcriptional regulator [Burkholderia oklahomensis]AIO69353.1 helix-turn-helix domain protein [Burkholderia oklahomensis]AOI40670.1 AraC family transcriptional regulator [Burkholderia oklahomensis EO147]KUY68403.1 AraC family transcriptional regulator [Burkholderia oklahomensis EO147]QPS39572.1 AraC family transcriptional regulator [Burkholderia oklahomensis]